jgi:hypothetical protein
VLPTDARGAPRAADGDGDGVARFDAGAYEVETVLPAAPPVLASVTPSFVPAGGAGGVLTIDGAGFMANAVAMWNGTPRATFVRSPTQLDVTIPAGDVNTISDIATAALTVQNPGTTPSNAIALTIVSARVRQAQSRIALPGSATTASVNGTVTSEGSVSTTFTNNDPSSGWATVSVATYAGTPIGGTFFAVGGYFDVRVVGADPSDRRPCATGMARPGRRCWDPAVRRL